MKKLLFAILSVIILATTLAGQEISFNLTPEEEAEKASWLAKGLMYPKYGYDKVSWGDGVDEVKKRYTGLVNTSDEDSLFGMRKFSQKVNSGGIVKREFYFYQGGLIKVTVQYDKSVKAELIRDKIKETYDEKVYPKNAYAGNFSPSAPDWGDTYAYYKSGAYVESTNRYKDYYTLTMYRHSSVGEIDGKVELQRNALKKQREGTDKKKQMDAMDL